MEQRESEINWEKNDSFFSKYRYSSFLCAAENLSPKGFKTVLEIDTQGTFNMCHAAFSEVDGFFIYI